MGRLFCWMMRVICRSLEFGWGDCGGDITSSGILSSRQSFFCRLGELFVGKQKLTLAFCQRLNALQKTDSHFVRAGFFVLEFFALKTLIQSKWNNLDTLQ